MVTPSDPSNSAGRSRASDTPRVPSLLRAFRERLNGARRIEPKKWAMAGLGFVVLLLVIWAIASSPPSPPPAPKSPQGPLLQTYHYWAIGSALLLGATVAMSLHIGTLTLSSQTLTHRRNVLLGGVLLVLAEIFNVDALKSLSIDPNTLPTKTDGTSFTKEGLVLGMLALFSVFSYMEYLYNFIADYMKARIDFQKVQKESPLVFISFRGLSQLLVGAGRIVFDVLLPAAVVVFASLLYHRDAAAVVDIVQGFLERKFQTVQVENPQIRSYVDKAADAASSAQDGVRRTIEDLKSVPIKN
jgi:hypothetical protein